MTEDANTERLAILLEARVNDIEKQMAKASRELDRGVSRMERRAKEGAQKIERSFDNVGSGMAKRFSTIGSSFAGGFVAGGALGFGFEQMVQGVQNAVKSVADMADEAARINVDVEDFQALAFSARQSGVETDKMTDLLQKFNVEIGEAATKGGALADLLRANGVAITDANGKIRSTRDLFFEVVDLITRAKTQQDAANVAQIAFGRAAQDALPWLQSGSKAMKEGEQAARDVGAVISSDLVAKAQEFDDKLTALWDSFTANGKASILAIGVAIEDLLKKYPGVVGLLTGTVSGGSEFDKKLRQGRNPFDAQFFFGGEDTGSADGLTKQLRELEAKRDDIRKQHADAFDAGRPQLELDEYVERLAAVVRQIEELQKTLEEQRKVEGVQASPGPSFEQNRRGPKLEPQATIVPQKLDKSADDLTGSAKELQRAAEALESAANSTGTAMMRSDIGPLDPRQIVSFREAAAQGILPLIRAAEGTASANGYNTSLAHGVYLPGGREQPLSTLTLDKIDELQSYMLNNPANKFNSSALGAYQIVQKTLRGLRSELGLSGDTIYSPELQDRLAQTLLARRGPDPAALRNEWEGLRRVDDGTINQALGNSSGAMQAGTEAINARKVATDSLIETQRRENQSLQTEAQTVGASTFEQARARKEIELLNAAKSAGIPLTAQVRQSIAQLSNEYATGVQSIEDLRKAQDAAAQSSAAVQQRNQQIAQQFEGAFGGAFKGFLSDLLHGKDATEALQGALMNLADSLLSMATDNLFSGLFGGTGGSAKGGAAKSGGSAKAGGAGLFSMFGFADGGLAGRDGRKLAPALHRFAGGGHVRGPGTGKSDSIAAMLSNGEFVITAEKTAKHRHLIEAINSGAIDRLPRYAEGGLVGSPKLANAPASTGAGEGAPINLTSNVTVNSPGTGDPKHDEAMARTVAKTVEASMRGLVVREIMAQQRNGGILRR